MAQSVHVGGSAPSARANDHVLAGIDKFLHVLANWEVYLSPAFARISPLSVHGTMQVVGVIECAAGIAVAFKPRYGAYVVAAWLAGIILNLILLGNFYDIALRDLGLCLAALALGRLSKTYDQTSGETRA
jgi:hypothetical protein